MALLRVSCCSAIAGRELVRAAEVSLDEVLSTLQERGGFPERPKVVGILLCVVDPCNVYISAKPYRP